MPEEIPDRKLALSLLDFHSGQDSALYSVGSCMLANKREWIKPETVQLAVNELRKFGRPVNDDDQEQRQSRKDAMELAHKLDRWCENRTRMTPFITAYIDAALWSSSCNETENDDTPLSERYSMADIDDESIDRIIKDCNDFISQCYPKDLAKQRDDQNGHDFWLTRNHHGAGFWDRGLGNAGKRLTDIAHGMGSSDIYVGDDKKLYVA